MSSNLENVFEIMSFNYLILVRLLGGILSHIHYYKNIMPESQVLGYRITIAFSTFIFSPLYLIAFNILNRFIVYGSEQLEPVCEPAMLFPAPHPPSH